MFVGCRESIENSWNRLFEYYYDGRNRAAGMNLGVVRILLPRSPTAVTLFSVLVFLIKFEYENHLRHVTHKQRDFQ